MYLPVITSPFLYVQPSYAHWAKAVFRDALWETGSMVEES